MLKVSLPVNVADHRGRDVPLFDELEDRWSRDAAAVETRRATKRGYGSQWTRQMSGEEFVLGLITAFVPMAFMLGWKFLVGPLNWTIFPICFAIGVITATVNRRALRRTQGKKVVESLLEVRRCASCGYALVDLPRETDGCTVCAECGAAWRLGGA